MYLSNCFIHNQESNSLIQKLPSAAFLSIDLEMTGIGLPNSNRPNKSDNPSERYTKMKQIPERYNIIQVGIAVFHENPKFKRYVKKKVGEIYEGDGGDDEEEDGEDGSSHNNDNDDDDNYDDDDDDGHGFDIDRTMHNHVSLADIYGRRHNSMIDEIVGLRRRSRHCQFRDLEDDRNHHNHHHGSNNHNHDASLNEQRQNNPDDGDQQQQQQQQHQQQLCESSHGNNSNSGISQVEAINGSVNQEDRSEDVDQRSVRQNIAVSVGGDHGGGGGDDDNDDGNDSSDGDDQNDGDDHDEVDASDSDNSIDGSNGDPNDDDQEPPEFLVVSVIFLIIPFFKYGGIRTTSKQTHT